jgi:hypothetical protein
MTQVRSCSIKRRPLLAAALAGGLCLAAAPAAQADSISFIRAGDIWLTTPDGSREHRVTTGGGWQEATQADDGTIVATKENAFHRMDQNGNELNAPFTVESLGSSGPAQPFSIRISPDGRRVTFFENWGGDVRFTDSDKASPGGAYAYPSGRSPSWVDNERVIFVNTCLYTTGYASGSGGDWSYCDHEGGQRPMGDLEMTRSRDKLVVVRTHADSGGSIDPAQLRFYSANGGPPAAPTPRCTQEIGSTIVGNPTWSPDGGRLAYSESDPLADTKSVHVQPAPDLGTCAQPGGEFTIPGARSPDWGPADVPAAGSPEPGPTPTDGPLVSASGPTSMKIKTALKKGVKIKVQCSVACTSSGTLRYKGKKVGSGRKALGGGSGTLVLKFTAKGKKQLKKLKKAKLAVAVEAADGQNRTSAATGSVTLKR